MMRDYSFLQGKDLQVDTLSLDCTTDRMVLSIQANIQGEAVLIRFHEVSMLKLRDVHYPMQLECLEIIDHAESGYDPQQRYRVHDYEDDMLDFYCASIELCDVVMI